MNGKISIFSAVFFSFLFYPLVELTGVYWYPSYSYWDSMGYSAWNSGLWRYFRTYRWKPVGDPDCKPEPEFSYEFENVNMIGGDVMPHEDNTIHPNKRVWPGAVIPYKIAPELVNQTKNIKAAMLYIECKTCIRFYPRVLQKNYIRLMKGIGCHSHVGMAGGGSQNVSLGEGCYKVGKIMHELVHAVGFNHEHQRPDRDDYITILWENIKPGHNESFDKLTPQDYIIPGPYDYDSIMHYSSVSFSKDKPGGLKTMVPKKKGVVLQRVGDKVLSYEDIRRINTLYNCWK